MNIVKFFIIGILASLLFPPYFIFPIGFIIFPYLCYFLEKNIEKLKKKKIFTYFFFFGIGLFGSFLFWIHNPFLVFEETEKLFFLAIILIILLSLILAIISSLIIFYNKILSPIILLPIVFILTEVFLSTFLYGFPWFTFSLVVSNIDLFMVSQKNFGTIITSYLVVQIFCIPYYFIQKNINKNINIYFISSLSLPLIFVFISHSYLNNNKIKINKTLNLELFQINKPIIVNKEVSQIQEKKIIKLVSTSDADLLVFGENNFPYIVKNNELNKLQKTIKKNQTLIIGGTRLDKNKYYNSLFNITDSNVSYFDKEFLVPFGEFLPFRKVLNFFEPISGLNDYTSGSGLRKIKINSNLYYIPIICYEIIFYWKIINKENFKSDFIVNITNDIWFGKIFGPYQHLYLTKLRAAEFNKSIIRVSNNGITSIIDRNGRIIYSTELNKSTTNKIKIKIEDNLNYYNTHNLLNLYFLIILIIIIFLNIIKIHDIKKQKL